MIPAVVAGHNSHVELQLEVCFISIDLERTHSDDLRTIESANKLIAADAKFAFPGLDLMVLHSSGFVGHRAVNPLALNRDRGGDVTHMHQ
jgi:hypothetical protein